MKIYSGSDPNQLKPMKPHSLEPASCGGAHSTLCHAPAVLMLLRVPAAPLPTHLPEKMHGKATKDDLNLGLLPIYGIPEEAPGYYLTRLQLL